MNRTLGIAVVLLLCSCSSRSGAANFAGIWDMEVSLTHDGCEIDNAPDRIADVLTIKQVGSELTITDKENLVTTGVVDSSNSFVSTDGPVEINSSCSGTGTTRYYNLNGDQAKASSRLDVDCGEDLTCSVEFGSGTATRRPAL